ncbi:MAG: LPS assembly lipoprotein LptE, partial [Deltaproteobacteria bacterium]|nr:LPS assembly lipoprotein LptE [Deltaproteobacteria bacterium]
LLCVLALSGCGYGFGADGPSVLEAPAGVGLPTLKFKSVESPTFHTWLPYIIRSEMRDEIAARDLARWVDSGPADYELEIKVDQFTFRSWITDRDDDTMLYSAAMVLSGTIYRGNSNEVVWRSGKISYSQSYETVQERVAASDLTRELARRFATAMRQAF